MQLETVHQAIVVLAQSPVDFHVAFNFFVGWTQGIDHTQIDAGLIVRVRFPGLLPEFMPTRDWEKSRLW